MQKTIDFVEVAAMINVAHLTIINSDSHDSYSDMHGWHQECPEGGG